VLCGGARIPPAVNQVEGHPQLPQPRLRAYCAGRGIALYHYSPLHPLGDDVARPVVEAAAARLGTSPQLLLFAWALRVGAGVVTTSKTPGRMAESLECRGLAARLSESDMAELNQISSLSPSRRFWLKNYGDDFEG